jgi:CRP/FNR family transcriptional regulator, nitrogen fixation regulation protein
MPPHLEVSTPWTPSRMPRSESLDVMSPIGLRMAFAKDEEIRTTRLMSDGRRQIGEFYYPGEVFGIEAGPRHRYSAEALSDTLVVAVKASALRAATGGEAFERWVGEAASNELDRAQEHLMLLGRKSAYERVATFLMDIADRRRSDAVVLPMSRQDMADYLGLTIETVSRMLTRLQASLAVEFAGARQFRICNRFELARLAH